MIDDVTLPTDRGTTQIDHIVISPYGVFVIETKNYSGWIFGEADQVNWTQVVYKEKNKFHNPIRQNRHHIRTMQSIFKLRPDQIHGYVVFTGDGEFKTDMPANVVRGAGQLTNIIRQHTKQVLSEHEVQGLFDAIQSKRLQRGGNTDRVHIRNLKEAAHKRTIGCPRCGSEMVERTNKKTGDKFLGCKRYPRCNGTRPASPNP